LPDSNLYDARTLKEGSYPQSGNDLLTHFFQQNKIPKRRYAAKRPAECIDGRTITDNQTKISRIKLSVTLN
jgi:hypothetical protein